ncbi:MAG TPA: hypothetical protein VFV48_06520 [Pseudomonadales bacterium]|nr:hypothetical protein [Pseudomonadales bacterium]
MAKQRLNEKQYIEEMNRQLHQHEQFQNGMAFVPHPAGAEGRAVTGYSTIPPLLLTGVYAQVAHRVELQFELDV